METFEWYNTNQSLSNSIKNNMLLTVDQLVKPSFLLAKLLPTYTLCLLHESIHGIKLLIQNNAQFHASIGVWIFRKIIYKYHCISTVLTRYGSRRQQKIWRTRYATVDAIKAALTRAWDKCSITTTTTSFIIYSGYWTHITSSLMVNMRIDYLLHHR